MHYGSWKFDKLDQNTEWEVVVTGQSPVDFTYDFLQAGPGGYGQFAIKGRPIAGKSFFYIFLSLPKKVPHCRQNILKSNTISLLSA